ncbi:MAG: SulP family inorganic anion transporter, partial [Planctomycetota bacterium]
MAESNAVLNFFRSKSASYKDDLLSGITVALALVPEAVAFAFVAGVSPLIGLYSAFFIGLITAVAGGRPGMISGATGAMAVVVVALVATQGIEYLFPTVVLCGLIQLVIGAARLGRLIRMVPHSVMLGFVNGLAIVIGMAQLGSFKHLNWQSGQLQYLTGTPLAIMLGLVGLTMATIWLLPKLTRAVPASLVAIVGVTILSFAINYSMPGAANPDGTPNNMVATVGDMLLDKSTAIEVEEQQIASGAWQRDDHGHIIVTDPEAPLVVEIPAVVKEVQASGTADISGSLPIPFFMQYALPPLEWQTLWIILPFSLTLAGVGLIESLMTLSLVDEITETRGDGNRECLGQGTANVICGLFGGMGGCAMIGQSLINVNSGGRGRLSGITAAVCLLLFILFLSPWIVQIPIAALVGVMFMVVIGTFEWASLKMFRRIP